jgi:predicted CXXCH cytochrome family protein
MRKMLYQNKPGDSVHGVIKGAGCVLCHDPHAGDERYMLRKPINDLCLGCHQENVDLKMGHPIARHPFAGPTERRRPGRELTCVGCHDPHGSRHEHLLVETKVGGRLCRGCHRR